MGYPRIATGALLVLVAAAATGCNAIGVVADAIAGPPRVDAVYDLPKAKTVVLVDDPGDLLPTRDLPNRIAGRVGDELVAQKRVTQVIGPRVINDLAAGNPDFDTWALDKVGRRVGADQVVYVVIQSFVLTENNEVYEPQATATVKVLDVDSSKRLFPVSEPNGHVVVATERPVPRDGASSKTDGIIARRVADALADKVAKLFYDHRLPDVGERLPG